LSFVVVTVATIGYGVNHQGIRVRFLIGARDYSLLHGIHTDMGAHLASYTKGIEYSEKTYIRDNIFFQDSVGNTMVNPDVSGGWPQSKSLKKFQDQLLYASQVGKSSSA
jgi:hypothetical protein